MRIDAAAGRRRRPISVTSLIDVIFLLLLFFMLTSTFAKFAEVEITGGRAGQSVAGGLPDVIIRLDAGHWSVNGLRLPEEAALAELVRLERAGASSAVILVRGDMTSQALVGAVEAIRNATRIAVQVAK
jgi:biopolymer transport protein ExbD